MRRNYWFIAGLLFLAIIVTACGGKKDPSSIAKDLDQHLGKMESYHATGVMTLHGGPDPQQYTVEVCYEQPHFYRIALTNEKKDVTQIVLRNDDGVFVLTPHLNKSFRFQSNWPESQGQVYLYQTLVKSIIEDEERQMITEKEDYIFDVAANYQNGSIARQKVWIDQKNLSVKKVEVSDAAGNILVDVVFNQFHFGHEFDENWFEMDRNMTGFLIQSVPTLSGDETDDSEGDSKGDNRTNETDEGAAESSTSGFGIIQPTYIPEGTELQDSPVDLELGNENAVMLRYGGTYNYTITEARPLERAVTMFVAGDVLDLGFTFGVLLGEEQKSLVWLYDGIEYRLTSADLPQSEMVKIAQSMVDQVGK